MSPPQHLHSSLSRAVRAYKRETDYFLEWLWCQCRIVDPGRTTGISFTSCAEILNAVKAIAKAEVAVPLSVIGALENAIDKRRIALAIHQQKQADDIEHEAFLEKLETALEILTPLEAESAVFDDPRVQQNVPSSLNRYASLSNPVIDPETDAPVSNICEKMASAALEESVPKATAPESRSEFLVDDDFLQKFLGVRFEDVEYLREYVAMRWTLDEYWTEAAEGRLPLPVAAWLTSEAMRKIEITIPSKLELRKTAGFVVRFGVSTEIFDLVPEEHKTDKPWWKECAFLFECEKALNGLKHCDEAANEATKSTPKPDKVQGDADTVPNVVSQLFQDMRRARGSKRAINAVEDIMFFVEPRNGSCEPFYQAASEFTKGEATTAPGTLVLGLDLFLSASGAFFWPNGRERNKDNCRLRALRLAMDMKASAKKVADIFQKLPICLSGERQWFEMVSYFTNGIDTYIRERVFDDYHSAPWTAGCHMAEMLYQAQYLGNLLLQHQTVIPSTLHLYNALRQSPVDLPRIRIMDELCEMFLDSVFLGKLPTNNFLTWYRYCIYNAKRAKTSNWPHYGNSGLSIDHSKKPRTLWVNSGFKWQHGNNHTPHVEFIGPLYGVPPPPNVPTPAALMTELSDMYYEIDDIEHIQLAKEAVLKDFEGPRAVMAVDYFSLFRFCADIMSTFAKSAKREMFVVLPELADMNWESDLELARHFVDAAIGSLVRMTDQKELNSVHQRPRAVHELAAFSKIDKEMSLDSMKWKL
ncbi:hypothetical protein KHU50_006323 [Colletotrichum sp. SAR 10_65]|nr:hypothetical protein KHU50_006323 [Colletotrichum sp. SAR 10_65]KAI8261216.1 hypothetical protein K4K53_000922 [Colletotrichum sp. SAR 10_77]